MRIKLVDKHAKRKQFHSFVMCNHRVPHKHMFINHKLQHETVACFAVLLIIQIQMVQNV